MRIMISAILLWIATVGVAAGGAQQPPPQSPRLSQPPPPPPSVKVGEPAPDFTLPYFEPPSAEGARPERREVALSSFKGKKNVVLAFFVAAFSPG